MLRELIGTLLLLLIASVLLLSGREISFKSEKTYLTTKASLIGNEDLDFKLSLNSNRLRLRRKTRFLPFLSGSSYYPGCLPLKNAKFCANACYNEEAFKNSISFSQELYISDLELIFTDDASVSDWWDWNGILGLNPFAGCENESNLLDPQAPLNQLRGNYSGFVLDYTRLIFTNEHFHGFQLPLDGMFFEMKEILFGDYNFGGVPMKGKLDLESRYIKVPARYLDFYLKWDLGMKIKLST